MWRDAQRIGVAFGDGQQGRLAGSFQQRVRGDGGAHLHRGNGSIAVPLHKHAHAGRGGVPIAFGVLRQQFQGDQRAIRAPPNDVGEGAAPVDPELPKPFRHWKKSLARETRRY